MWCQDDWSNGSGSFVSRSHQGSRVCTTARARKFLGMQDGNDWYLERILADAQSDWRGCFPASSSRQPLQCALSASCPALKGRKPYNLPRLQFPVPKMYTNSNLSPRPTHHCIPQITHHTSCAVVSPPVIVWGEALLWSGPCDRTLRRPKSWPSDLPPGCS